MKRNIILNNDFSNDIHMVLRDLLNQMFLSFISIDMRCENRKTKIEISILLSFKLMIVVMI